MSAIFANIKNKWDELKARGNKRAVRYLHISAHAKMVEVPVPGTDRVEMVPWVQKPGITYRKAAAENAGA